MFGSIRIRRWVPSVVASTLALLLLVLPSAGLQDCIVPPIPTVRILQQPDGSLIELYCRGNGLNHWYEDAEGFPVVETDAGYFFAQRGPDGRLVATEGLVGASNPWRLELERKVVPVAPSWVIEGKGVRASRTDDARYPGPQGPFLMGTGTVENLVLLLRFSNHGSRTVPSSADVSTIMNEVGGDALLAPTGSVRDHYIESSYGELVIDSSVAGWFTMPRTEGYYANGWSGLDGTVFELITDGLDAADAAGIDFSDFDEDGDGWIDAITFLHSGFGAETEVTDMYGTSPANRIWSHKYVLPTPWTSDEGVSVGLYSISSSLWGSAGTEPFHIGVVTHELGHYFGLPDQYDTDDYDHDPFPSFGSGDWCLMAMGAWGFDNLQFHPSHMCAWCKVKLGWVVPETILPGSYSAPAVLNTPAIYMIDSGYRPGEYLLIENRQSFGFDELIPQGGLAVWHVDESKGSLTWEDTNNDQGFPGQVGWPGNDNHPRIGLLQADGDYDLEHATNQGDEDDLYRAGFATVIDQTTTPNTNAYQGGTVVTNFNRLQGIGTSSLDMAFTYVNTTAPTITTPTLLFAYYDLPYSRTLINTGGSAPFTWSEFRADPNYSVTDLGAQTFVTGGTAQGLNADEGILAIDLPFQFPYYETSYSRVYVTPNGCVDLVPLENESANSAAALRLLPRIAGLWDDLTTGGAGEDIYVTTSSDTVRIRWQAETVPDGFPVNFAITLRKNGSIRFDYGTGNTGLTPTVGISRSHSNQFMLAPSHDRQGTLTNANSLELQLEGSALPDGLSLSPSGVLSGTPTQQLAYLFHVRVRDSIGRYDQKWFGLVVLPKPHVRFWPRLIRLTDRQL